MQNTPSIKELIQLLKSGDTRALARCITLVENDLPGSEEILFNLQFNQTPVIGITGPPGAGKSTLVNALISKLTADNKKVAVIAIDPTSPFNYGSLLGDRVRMAEHFNNPNVYIRSLATRGSLGGLSAKIIEITDVIKSSHFDYIIVETVGVGQSEVEIVGLADTTVLVLVPEAGDEVQTLKSGIMEIADVFVVNKSDRDGANIFLKNLQQLLHEKPDSGWNPKVVKTVATNNEGVDELVKIIQEHEVFSEKNNEKKIFLLTEKVSHLIQNKRMAGVSKKILHEQIAKELLKPDFNIYHFAKAYSA